MKTNFQKQAYIKGASDSISLEQIRKIDFQMTNCICNIIHNNITGTGFFCRIPFPDNYSLLPVLITCNHVLDERSISKGKRINVILNDESYCLLIDDSRKKYTDKIKDITFIEIKRNDNLQNVSFLDIDENFNLNGNENGKSIYVLHFEYGKYKKFSQGIIVYIKKSQKGFYKIMYSCSTQPGSSGGPIINSSNSKLIGIHIGYEQNYGLNLGMIIEVPKDFYNYQNLHNFERDYNILNNYSEYDFKEEPEVINKIEKKEKEIIHNKIEYNKYENNLIKCPQIHEHPFDFYEEINEQCNICYQRMEYVPGYKCNDCTIILCLDCTSKIFYEKKMNNPHHHPLKLTRKIHNWECDICGFDYSDKYISFFCHQCDFYACCFCYLDGNNKTRNLDGNNKTRNLDGNNKTRSLDGNNKTRNLDGNYKTRKLMIENNTKMHKHPLYYIEKLNTACTFCLKEIENKPGYECKTCSIILCLECDLIIFHKKTNFIHPHNLELNYHKRSWRCNLCMNSYNKSQASCDCRDCDFDICYRCYCNSLKN